MSTESLTAKGAGASATSEDGVTNPNGIGLFRMVTTVITLIVGAGVFSLSGDAAAGGASGWAIYAAWGISAVGVLCLVMTFFALSRVKPNLKGGIYTYAAEGFGDFLGFNSAWGYWISALLCTVSFSALLFGALSYFFPIFGDGTNIYAVIGASCIIWFYAFLVSRGISEVTLINAVITISKFVPLLVGLVAIIFVGAFKPDVFLANLQNGADPDLAFMDQVQTAMMVTMWVFIGIEGAVAISGRARKSKDVGKATVIAFCCVLTLYLLVQTLSMGVMPLSELANLENPALAYVMQAAVGDWGAILINFAVSLSLIGAMLGYTVLASESPFEAAEEGVFIKAFAKTNKKGAPVVTLVVTNLIIECFLITWLFTDSTYQFFYTLSAGMILVPYLLSAAYFTKVAFKEPGVFSGHLNGPIIAWRILGIVGIIYSLLLSYAAGLLGVILMCLLFVPGIFMYVWGKKERGEKVFESLLDKIVLALIILAACASVYLLLTTPNLV